MDKLLSLLARLRKLNPNMQFTAVDIDDDGHHYGIGFMGGDLGAIKWPQGFYVDSEKQLTNKHSEQGSPYYETYDLYRMTLLEK